MDKTGIYNSAIYTLLLCTSFILLLCENFLSMWSWLFAFLIYIFLTILNDFILNGRSVWNQIITGLLYVLILLLAYITAGFGSIPLVFILQAGMSFRYKSKTFVFLNIILFSSYTCGLYLFPYNNLKSAYPAVFMYLFGLVMMFTLLRLQHSIQLQSDNMEHIIKLQLNKKELRDLNKQIEHYNYEMEKNTILRERNRMSKQIHDTLGHVLTAVSVQLEAAGLLVHTKPDEAMKKIANAKEQTREGLISIKQSLSLIDEDCIQFEDRLFDTIKNAEKTMNTRILPQIKTNGGLSASVQELILSALKEGITNGVRHGQATAFVFQMNMENGRILFYLEDNGRGTEKINMGYGLTAMEKQISVLGGTLETHSVKDEGFVLKITLPCGEEKL